MSQKMSAIGRDVARTIHRAIAGSPVRAKPPSFIPVFDDVPENLLARIAVEEKYVGAIADKGLKGIEFMELAFDLSCRCLDDKTIARKNGNVHDIL
jgi:hypothetical protein